MKRISCALTTFSRSTVSVSLFAALKTVAFVQNNSNLTIFSSRLSRRRNDVLGAKTRCGLRYILESLASSRALCFGILVLFFAPCIWLGRMTAAQTKFLIGIVGAIFFVFHANPLQAEGNVVARVGKDVRNCLASVDLTSGEVANSLLDCGEIPVHICAASTENWKCLAAAASEFQVYNSKMMQSLIADLPNLQVAISEIRHRAKTGLSSCLEVTVSKEQPYCELVWTMAVSLQLVQLK